MPWLRRTFDSILSQSHTHFRVCVVDDCSTQPGQRPLIDHYCRKWGWTALFNDERVGCLANTAKAIEALECEPSDVIVTLDGDDWFAHTDVLATLDRVYESGGVELTYGQYMRYPSCERGHCRKVGRRVHKKMMYRDVPFRMSHLRSFLFSLWSKINDQDLRDSSGRYYTHATDTAFMYPMLEMSGTRSRFLDEPLYIYNRDTPFNEDKCGKSMQDEVAKSIRQLPRYQRVAG